jgi:hypothetical protein
MTSSSLIRKEVEFFGSAAANSVTLFMYDTELFDHITLQLAGPFVATVAVEGSNNNTDWFQLPTLNLTASSAAVGTNITAVGIYGVNAFCRYVRARTTAYTSGTVRAFGIARHGTLPFTTEASTISGLSSLATGTNLIGSTALAVSTTVGVPTTHYGFRSAASTNLISVKNSGSRLYSYQFQNTTATQAFVKFYNKNAAPVLATDIPLFVIRVPANGDTNGYFNQYGKPFSAGLAIACVANIANTDATATTVDQIIGHLDYI